MTTFSNILKKIYNPERDKMVTTRMLHTNLIVFRLVYFLLFVVLPMLFFKGNYTSIILILFFSAIFYIALIFTSIHFEHKNDFGIHEILLNISTCLGYICMKIIQCVLFFLSIIIFIYSLIPY